MHDADFGFVCPAAAAVVDAAATPGDVLLLLLLTTFVFFSYKMNLNVTDIYDRVYICTHSLSKCSFFQDQHETSAQPSSFAQHDDASRICQLQVTEFATRLLPNNVRKKIWKHTRREIFVPFRIYLFVLIRGTILNRTYGTHKNQYISLFLPTIFGPIYCGPQ